MIYCIVGETGAGKDTIARELQKLLDCEVVASYCDAPPRPDQQQGREHTFVSKEEYDKLHDAEEVIAETEIAGKRYCVTKQLLERYGESEKPIIYIIDPRGVRMLEDLGYTTIIFYVDVPLHLREERLHAKRRGFNLAARYAAEHLEFEDFKANHRIDLIIDNANSLDFTIKQLIFSLKNLGYNIY